MRQILSKKFLKYFLISFLIFEAILLLQFVSKYLEDIFGKGISFSIVLELFFFASITLIGFSLLFGVLIASIFTFRNFSLKSKFPFKTNIASGLLVIIVVSCLHFSFNNWILPNSTLELYAMIYDVKNTAPDTEFEKSDRSLFEKNKIAMSIRELNLQIDTANMEIVELISVSDSLLSLLPDSVAIEKYNKLDLEDYGVNYSYSKTDTLSERDILKAGHYLQSYRSKLKRAYNVRQSFKKEIFSKIILPIELILLYLIGTSFGYYYNDQKGFLLVILGLFTTIFFTRTVTGMETMIENEEI